MGNIFLLQPQPKILTSNRCYSYFFIYVLNMSQPMWQESAVSFSHSTISLSLKGSSRILMIKISHTLLVVLSCPQFFMALDSKNSNVCLARGVLFMNILIDIMSSPLMSNNFKIFPKHKLTQFENFWAQHTKHKF